MKIKIFCLTIVLLISGCYPQQQNTPNSVNKENEKIESGSNAYSGHIGVCLHFGGNLNGICRNLSYTGVGYEDPLDEAQYYSNFLCRDDGGYTNGYCGLDTIIAYCILESTEQSSGLSSFTVKSVLAYDTNNSFNSVTAEQHCAQFKNGKFSIVAPPEMQQQP